MSVVPESLRTPRWRRGTALLVLHDLQLATHEVPLTGVFFMDRGHQHIDLMVSSFAQATREVQLFALDRLLFALTEYVPCVFAWRFLLERSGASVAATAGQVAASYWKGPSTATPGGAAADAMAAAARTRSTAGPVPEAAVE